MTEPSGRVQNVQTCLNILYPLNEQEWIENYSKAIGLNKNKHFDLDPPFRGICTVEAFDFWDKYHNETELQRKDIHKISAFLTRLANATKNVYQFVYPLPTQLHLFGVKPKPFHGAKEFLDAPEIKIIKKRLLINKLNRR